MYQDEDSGWGWIVALVLYIMYLVLMTMILLAIGFVTLMIGSGMGLVKGISNSLETYFGTLAVEIGER